MLRGWTAGLAAAQQRGRSSRARSFQDTPVPANRRRLAIGTAAALAYVAALLATLPARIAFDPGPRWALAGTLWHGEAMLDGGWRLEWRWAPLRTLAALAFTADIRITGAGTDLAGTATIGRGRRLIEGLTGRADAGLLAALAPSAPLRCDAALQVDLRRLLIAGTDSAAVGEIRADGVSCGPPGTADTTADLPALILRALPLAGTTRIDVAPLDRPRLKLVTGGIEAGRLRIAATPAGTALLPALRALTIDQAM